MPNQVQNFLSKADKIVNPGQDEPPENETPQHEASESPSFESEEDAAEIDERNQPRVPFRSNLVLDREQENKMIEHAFTRLQTLISELGRDQTLSPNWWQNMSSAAFNALASQGLLASDTFMGKRSRYDATFMNDFSWRPFIFGPDSIFQSSNFATPVTRRVCRQMIAKAKNKFFGAEPWFAVDPAPVPSFDQIDDTARADKIEKFTRFKLREADSKTDKERAISRAITLGECAVKTSYVVRDQIFNTEARVLVDTTGEPVRAMDGNHITENEEFVDQTDEMGNNKRVLKRDGFTEEPLAPIWQNVPLNRRQVLFEGARSEPIYFKDFLCPLTAEDVQTADICAHLYDKPVMAFVDLVVKRGMVGDDTDERMSAARKMVAVVKELSNNSPAPKAAVKLETRPNDQYGRPPSVETGGPVAEFVEFYMWYDANGDGVSENIMLICDRNTKAPIFYDHVANVTTDGLRPIEIVRINPVEGRWYGQGVMELFDSYQTQIDLLVNRWNFSQSRSGRVDLWTPTNTVEGDANPNLKMNWGGTYTKKPGMKKEDVLESVYLTDIKFEQIHTQAQFFIQLLMNESGVSTANDDQAAGMQSAKLATGVIQTAESGDELIKPIISDLKGPLERILNREIDVILANINPQEAFTYLEGDTKGIDHITPDEVRGLRFKTTITLTTQKAQERVQISASISALIEKFYAFPPEIQIRVAPFYRKQIAAMDQTVDVDTLIVPLQPQMPGMSAMPAAGGGSALGGGGTSFGSQLSQRDTQLPGVSAPGGTPAGA